jgi:hypothetical protein
MIPSTDLTPIRRRHIVLMQTTQEIICNLLAPISQSTASMLRDPRDGAQGWSVLEVICHLRDFDTIFRERALRIVAEEYPRLPAFDHEAMARERRYSEQPLAQAVAEYVTSRQQTIAFFKGLNGMQWARAGIHPERGHFTMTDALLQVGTHDATHLEQVSRILYHNQ